MEKAYTCLVGSARHNEYGTYVTGKPGDQTGTEVDIQPYYTHKKGWRVFRALDPLAADKIAQAMEWACASVYVGYSQNDNQSLYHNVAPLNFDITKLTKPSNTDCARLVRVCVLYAGIPVSDFYTAIEGEALLNTGMFKEVTNKISLPAGLKRGDILVTKTKGHTVVALTNGDGTYERLTDASNTSLSSNTSNTTSSSSVKSSTPYLVKVVTDLNVRAGAGTSYKINTVIRDKGIYTIVEEDSTGKWGRLKSGAGWISLKYTKKI